MNLNEGINLARHCRCGLCHPQWFRNGWVCHGPLPSPSQPRSRPQWAPWNGDLNLFMAAAARRRQRDERRRLVPPSSQPQENRTHALFVTGMDGDLTLPQQAPTLNLYRPEEDPWNAPRPPVEFVPFSALPLRLGRPPYDDDESDSDDPDLLRALEESLRTAEAEEQSRAAADRERQDRLSGQCVVCLEEKHGGAACCTGSTSTTDTVTESTTHFICHECIPMYVGSELQNDDSSDRRLMERRAFGHCLRCPCSPMPLNCGGYLEERHVRPFLTTALWSQLQAASEADEKHLQWQKESRDNEDPEFLREALLRSMPNAVQCGRCQYGPIDHAGCDDLDAHHAEWRGNARIENQCPKCGWWAHSIRSWPSWDGVIRQ